MKQVMIIFALISGVHLGNAECLAQEASELLFVRYIEPLLREKCLGCHGENVETIESGLDVRTLEGLLKGGDSGAASLIPGKPMESPLYLAATREHADWSAMPPKDSEKLGPEQLGWIHDWIDAGAPWPNAERIAEIVRSNSDRWSAEDGVAVPTSGGLSPEWTHRKYKLEGLWAYQPVHKPNIPAKAGHPVDAFIAARIPAGQNLAPRASDTEFIRRATFDLIGLPPTSIDVEAFVDEIRKTNGADLTYRKLIDRLLASPHYGERMAQHWLDVVRYADSSGFANDFERGNAWRYRDYVVRAFNRDKPFDQFIREQIAGDELDPENPEMLIATGFLRMGPWELTVMEVPKIARQRFLDDVTNSVGETFLAHSLQCARCHDHKFDPIPQRDYYSMQAVFATTQLAERDAPYLQSENTDGFDEQRFLEQRRTDHLATLKLLDEKSLAAADLWFKQRGLDASQWQAAVCQLQQQHRNNFYSSARNVLLKQGISENQFPPRMLGWSPEEIGFERIATKGLERLTWEMDRYRPVALAVYNGLTPQVTSVTSPFRMPDNRLTDGEQEQTCILIGGDSFARGENVDPGALSVLENVQSTPFLESADGRRRALAEWISSPQNPLTTRTIVNRIWLWHFGQPIAGNPNNFGATGKRPTHPELLDWLASEFVENKWSFKALHRIIMNSEAYRRSTRSLDRDQQQETDPLGTSYTVFIPRRLTAEELRDAMLSITGELNPALGGIPNRPEINLEAALQPRQVMGTFADAWVPNPLPHQRHRRSLYALKLRGLADPFFEVFNAPTPDFSCERRDVSTVTPQVFSLFNGQASHARALVLAQRIVNEVQNAPSSARTKLVSDERTIVRCFESIMARLPTAEELQSSLKHWRQIEAMLDATPPPPIEPPLFVRRDAIEENTGEKFSFTEKLHANEEYVSDLQPHQVSIRIRALADVCLVLFNSNEFAYVY